jgi:stage V sporulation protein AB
VALVGLAEGLAVGAALAALVVLLAVAIRLAVVTGTEQWVHAYQWALVLGALAAAGYEAWPYSLHATWGMAAVLGLGMGLFIGLVVAGLAETVGSLVLAGGRLGLARQLPRLVIALVLGKAVGAVLWFLVPGLFSRPPF